MVKKLALAYLAIFSPVIIVTFLISNPASEVIFALLAIAFPVALIAVGASKEGSLGPLSMPLFGLFVLLEGCVIAMLLLKGKVLSGPWFLGLPLSASIQLYAAWLTPLVLVSLAYGLTFERFSLKEEDLAKLDKFIKKETLNRETD